MNDPLEQSLISYLHQRVRALEAENEALRDWRDAVQKWADGQREFFTDQANEAEVFFSLFGDN